MAIRVDTGGDWVQLTGRTIAEIVRSTTHVSEILENISAASAEQNAEIEQINQSVARADRLTQQNATLVQKAGGAAEALQYQAVGLEKVVGSFKL